MYALEEVDVVYGGSRGVDVDGRDARALAKGPRVGDERRRRTERDVGITPELEARRRCQLGRRLVGVVARAVASEDDVGAVVVLSRRSQDCAFLS